MEKILVEQNHEARCGDFVYIEISSEGELETFEGEIDFYIKSKENPDHGFIKFKDGTFHDISNGSQLKIFKINSEKQLLSDVAIVLAERIENKPVAYKPPLMLLWEKILENFGINPEEVIKDMRSTEELSAVPATERYLRTKWPRVKNIHDALI